jgi:hypothetical protein
MQEKTIIEINGVKLEVDLRHAKRIEELRIGSPVKCLVKKFDDYAVFPGVIVGFEPFKGLPSILVAYLEVGYSAADLKFKTFNTQSKDFEIVADVNFNRLELNRDDVLSKMDREIAKKEIELEEATNKRDFFLANFGRYFANIGDVKA